jgi:hypothetical protein
VATFLKLPSGMPSCYFLLLSWVWYFFFFLFQSSFFFFDKSECQEVYILYIFGLFEAYGSKGVEKIRLKQMHLFLNPILPLLSILVFHINTEF